MEKNKEKKKKIIALIISAAVLIVCCVCVAISTWVAAQDQDAATGTDAKEVLDMAKDNTDEEKKDTAELSKPETTENTDKKDAETVVQDKPKKKDDEKKPATTEAGTKPQQTTQQATTETQPQTTETTTNTKPQQTTQAATTEANTNTKPQQTTQQATTETQPQKVWVVDQVAYDEERPIYETRCRWICTGCGGYMYNQVDIDNHTCNASWYSDIYDVQIGTETVHHDEVGHWEYR